MPGDATPSLTVTVYRQAKATLYGPGFYGNKTACGTRLTKTTIGVANRTLPCGSTVSLLFHGRTLSVPVIDRGPYANHADWDLTTATADAIGMEGTSQIGAVMLPKVPASVRLATGVAAAPVLIGAQTGH
jgi:rare lipoprotein A